MKRDSSTDWVLFLEVRNADDTGWFSRHYVARSYRSAQVYMLKTIYHDGRETIAEVNRGRARHWASIRERRLSGGPLIVVR